MPFQHKSCIIKQKRSDSNDVWKTEYDKSANGNQPEYAFEGGCDTVGVFMSDTGLFQRTYSDDVATDGEYDQKLRSVLTKNSDVADAADIRAKRDASIELMRETAGSEAMLNSFVTSTAFPQFYGLALPLLKYGLPVRQIQLDNIRRFTGYLSGLRYAVLSYEYMKPVSPDINMTISKWVRGGGTLIYVGDGSDPFHAIRSWWRDAGYDDPAQHLFDIMGIGRTPAAGEYTFGNGRVVVYDMLPAKICLTAGAADEWRGVVRTALQKDGAQWNYRNDITLRRGPYIISAVMDESVNDEPKVFKGRFVDMMADGFPIIGEKTVRPDENALLFDLETLRPKAFQLIGTAARISDLDLADDRLSFKAHTADNVLVHIRARFPFVPTSAEARYAAGGSVELKCEYDESSDTVLLSYRSNGEVVTICCQQGAARHCKNRQ